MGGAVFSLRMGRLDSGMNKLRVLDLFSGIGGFSIGLERTGGFETVAFCEIEPFPRRVLAKHWPEVYCHDDVRTLTKDTLWKGYAQNALLNQLCGETGGGLATVKSAMQNIRSNCAPKTHQSTMNGPQSAEEALSIIMAGNVPVAEKQNTLFWQLITNKITEIQSGPNIVALCGKSLSSEDCLTIIKFFAITATWQNQYMVPAHIKRALGVDGYGSNGDAFQLSGIDVITGGFPCQDLSVAGKQRGMGEGTRSGLWSEIVRLVGELRPRFVIVENVAALLAGPIGKRGGWFGRVLGDLAECGYDAEWENIPAAALGAPHRRERVWLVAYPAQDGNQEQHFAFGRTRAATQEGAWVSDQLYTMAGIGARDVSSANSQHEQGQQSSIFDAQGRAGQITGSPGSLLAGIGMQWEVEPALGRVANGVPDRAHRLAAIGNAVVPQIPELIGRAILAASP